VTQYRLLLEYDGTDYCGWQIQPDQRTVQATLEEALARLLGCPTRLSAAGRTDAGVHAAGQVACFRTTRSLDPATVRRALNALTPRDLAVRCVDTVPDDFDPRRSASSREYVYRIWNRRVLSPFWQRYAWHVGRRDDMVVYTIEGTAFLRHMVRNIVGTLVEVGWGAREVDSVRELIQLRDRARAAATAPPHGLCLTRVDYGLEE
jgi:tRNA pseudouridine38-40 synthase